ncbi:sensitivity to high expression protein she9 [Chytriomyces hyalinus]|nr:sensitivity to high expression protein she9 [Chytriomyces hyalinus]
MHAVNPTRMFRTHIPLIGISSRVLRFNSAVFVPFVSRRFSAPVTPTTPQPPSTAAPSAVPPPTQPIKSDPRPMQQIKAAPKQQTQSLVHTFNQEYLPALSTFMNKVTGYDSVVERKMRVEAKGNQLKDASRSLEDAKIKYEESIDERRRCQKEINSLLQRKDSWIDQDILQFTTLYRKDHTLEAKETDTKVAYKAASAQYDTINTDYLSLIRERYIDEQLYSDKIRAASVYWTILHLSIFLIFSLVGWGLKVRDREVLLAGVEEIFAKSLATQSLENANTDFAKLVAKDGTVIADSSASADSVVGDVTSTPHESNSREGTFLFRGATTWVADRLRIPREDASFVVGLCLGAAVSFTVCVAGLQY